MINRPAMRESLTRTDTILEPVLPFAAGAVVGLTLTEGWPTLAFGIVITVALAITTRLTRDAIAHYVLSASLAAALPLFIDSASQTQPVVAPAAWIALVVALAAVLVALSPPSRLSDTEIATALDNPLGEHPTGDDLEDTVFDALYGALKDELERAIAAVQSIGDRTAALPPIVIGLGALSLADIPLSGPLFGPSLAAIVAAVVGAVVATCLAFVGLRTRRFSFGPNPIETYRAAVVTGAPHRRMLLRSMARITHRALETTQRRAWFFNLALEAGTVSILAVFVLRLLGATGGN